MVKIKKTIPNFVSYLTLYLNYILMKRFCRMMVMSGIFLTIFTLIPECSSAQIGDPGDDPDAPIDGGVSLLVAAGVGYGIKKAKEGRKKNKTVPLA